jgi:hypothetical protein
MGQVAEAIPPASYEWMDPILGLMGLKNPVPHLIAEADFDVRPLAAQLSAFSEAQEQLSGALNYCDPSMMVSWAIDGVPMAPFRCDCPITALEVLTDCMLLIIEAALQILDYILDLIHLVCSIVVFLGGLIGGIIQVIGTISALAGGAGLAAALAEGTATLLVAIGAETLAVPLAIAAILGLLAILLWLLDKYGVEEWQRSLRESIEVGCWQPGRLLPDWDPKLPELPS